MLAEHVFGSQSLWVIRYTLVLKSASVCASAPPFSATLFATNKVELEGFEPSSEEAHRLAFYMFSNLFYSPPKQVTSSMSDCSRACYLGASRGLSRGCAVFLILSLGLQHRAKESNRLI